MIKTIAHYALLVFTIYLAVAYWIVSTSDELTGQWIQHGRDELVEPASGVVAFLLHPAFAYLLLAMSAGLILKEFFVSSMRRRAWLNFGGLLVVCFFVAVLQTWSWNRFFG
jgi:uncharacterized membrane protein